MRAIIVAAFFCLLAAPAFAQTAAPSAPPTPAELTLENRPITTFRANLGTRSPASRAQAASTILRTFVRAGVVGPVAAHPLQNAIIITVGDENVFALLPEDADDLAGQTLQSISAGATTHLTLALTEALELRRPEVLIRATLLTIAASLLAGFLFWLLVVAYRRVSARLVAAVEDRLTRYRLSGAGLPRMTPIFSVLRGIVRVVALVLAGFIIFSWLTFALNRFPYTRPWGEGLRHFLVTRMEDLGLSVVHALPGLFTVLVIFVVTRFGIYCLAALFDAVERRQVQLPFVDADLARPTGRILAALAWVFCIVMAYPYIPGSNSDAFRGVSVFVGLIVSLGSSGLVNQLMSGFVITYSRSVRKGEFAEIAGIQGTIVSTGVLATTVRTPYGEEMNIPNAIVVSHVVRNYSRPGDRRGVWLPTSVTIGYDTPWRQVHAMLLAAAAKTPGIVDNPAPEVRQTALQDFYVEYTLLIAPAEPRARAVVLATLHSHIQDLFNENGVQIMSPHYLADPRDPKIVPRAQWFAAPAKPE